MTTLDIETINAVNDKLKKGLERKFLEFGWLFKAAPIRTEEGYSINAILENPGNCDFPDFLKKQAENILHEAYVLDGQKIPVEVRYIATPPNYGYKFSD